MATQTWLITGVNSGFGRQMTEQLLTRGDRVAGTVRRMTTPAGLQLAGSYPRFGASQRSTSCVVIPFRPR